MRFPGLAGLLLSLCALSSAVALGQGHPIVARGLSSQSAYASDGIDSVNLFNRSLNLAIPLGAFPLSSTTSYGFALYYSSNVWDIVDLDDCLPEHIPCQRAELDASSNAGLGWRLSLGRLLDPNHAENESDMWLYLMMDGSRHYFYHQLHIGEDDGSVPTKYTRDGTSLRLDSSTKIIDFPDGSKHTFNGPDGELTRIEDAFGNWVDVTIGASSWSLSDRHGRAHTVSFTTVAGRKQVSTVDLAAFGNTRAVYSFSYETASIYRPFMDTDENNSATVTAALLSSISGPESLSFTIQETGGAAAYFRGGPDSADPSGQLRKIQLPTKGTIEWTYDVAGWPVPSDWIYLQLGFGVASKQTTDSWGSGGSWTYSSVTFPATNPDEVQTTVVNPASTRTVHYFAAPTSVSTSGWTGWEYGLPFTWRSSSGGKYLSSEVFDASSNLVRSHWLRFTHDKLSGAAPQADWYNSNRRAAASRARFDDDGARYSDVSYSNFDGLGHFRVATLQGDLEFSTTRYETTYFNPTRGCYEIDLATNQQTCTGGNAFVPIGPSEKWLLGTYSYTEQSEGGATARQEASFNSANGFLDCARVLKTGTSRGTNDVLVTFGNDGQGNPDWEKWWGGDAQSLGTTSTCATAAAPAYWLDHSFASGALASTRYKNSAGTAVNFWSFNAVIDNNTGLVKDAYDVSGFLARFNLDRLGRPTLIESLGSSTGERESRTRLSYSAPSGGTSSYVNVTRECPTDVSCGTTYGASETYFDGFGRPWKQRILQADGTTWSRRQTSYNALGWVTAFSELGPNTGTLYYNNFTNFDALGRPGKLFKADGKEMRFYYWGDRQVERWNRIYSVSGQVENWAVTSEGYDALGRLRRVWEPAMPDGTNVNTNYSYDVGNRLSHVDQLATVHQHRYFNFDNRGFLTSEYHPEKGSSGNGAVSYLNYDARGHAGEIRDGSSSLNLLFSFDAAERLLTVTEGGTGRSLKSFTYGAPGDGNALGRLKTAVRHNYLPAPLNTDYLVSEIYDYNGIGRRVSKRKTETSYLGVAKEYFEQTWTYGRDGNVTSISYPRCFTAGCPAGGTAARTVNQTFSQGYLTGISGFVSNIGYHLNGMLNAEAFANNVSHLVFNDPYHIPRPQEIRFTQTSTGNQLATTGTYSYDSSGNIKNLGGGEFLYDLGGRMKSGTVFVAGLPRAQSVTYDGFGNLTSLTTSGVLRNTPTSTSTNRLTAGTYDAAGNLTAWNGATFSYDRLNSMFRLTNGSEDWLFAYTADDERIMEYRIGGGAWRTALRDLDGKILREYRTEQGGWSAFEDFVYRQGTLVASIHPTEGTRYFGPDHLGTPRAVFNTSGAIVAAHTYYPFGEEATPATQDTQQMKFTGHERDLLNTPTSPADDTDYMHHRQFSILTGRFQSFDPVGGNAHAPQSWNRYAYVLGNPMKYVDPYGLDATCARVKDENGIDIGCAETIHVLGSDPHRPTGGGPGGGGGGGGHTGPHSGGAGPGSPRSDGRCDDACEILRIIGTGNKPFATFAEGSAYFWSDLFTGGLVSGLESVLTGNLDEGLAIGAAAALIPGNLDSAAIKVAREFNEQQRALIELAKEAKNLGGVTAEEARTLRNWADSYKLPSRGPEIHPGRRFGVPHIHIGPVGHIPVRH